MFSFFIDIATLGYNRIAGKPHAKLHSDEIRNMRVTSLIPAYNEGAPLERAIESHLSQTHPPDYVIVADDCSTDDTQARCQEMTRLYPPVIYSRGAVNLGKAATINRIMSLEHEVNRSVCGIMKPSTYRKVPAEQSIIKDYVLVTDGDVVLEPATIESMLSYFTDDSIAAVTSNGSLLPTGNAFDREVHRGKSWSFSMFEFRKRAQSYRNAISVINGSCTMYRKEILERYPLRIDTKTEDTDHTWELLEEGYRLVFDSEVSDSSEDIIGVGKHYSQTFRWFSGTWQCVFTHNKKLLRSPWLVYSSLTPMFIDAVGYSVGLLGLPLVGALCGLGIIDHHYFYSGIMTDLALTVIPTIFIKPQFLKNLPGIYIYKSIAAAAFLHSGVKTVLEKMQGNEETWSNQWGREQNT